MSVKLLCVGGPLAGHRFEVPTNILDGRFWLPDSAARTVHCYHTWSVQFSSRDGSAPNAYCTVLRHEDLPPEKVLEELVWGYAP